MSVQSVQEEIMRDVVDEAPSEQPAPVRRSDNEFNEFNYRPTPVLAVAGFVVALLSSLGILIWMVLPLCLVALLMSALALVSIRRSEGAYGGTAVAVGGIAVALACLGAGIGLQLYAYQTEVPEGYQRLSFHTDISEKGVVQQVKGYTIHPDVAALEGKKVFLKGFIYQTNKIKDLSAFLLVKDNQDCCFGASPALWDRLGVVMQDGKTIDYKAGKVAISGTFRINPEFNADEELNPLYIIEGEKFSSRVSDF